MKLKITCPKCKSNKVEIVENPNGKSPLYECSQCKYKQKLFPEFESDKKMEDE